MSIYNPGDGGSDGGGGGGVPDPTDYSGTSPITVVDATHFDLRDPNVNLRGAILAGQSFSGIAYGAVYGASSTYRWAFGAFGGEQGYPQCVAYHQQRRVFACTYGQPQTVWMSRSGTFLDFSTTRPSQDDDAVSFTLNAGQLNAIKGMLSIRKLVLLSTDMEWVVSSGNSASITPSAIQVDPQSYRGSSGLPPIGIGNVAVYVQAKGQVVRDLGYDFASDAYAGADLTVMASHLLQGKQIVDWAWQQTPFSCIWMVRNDGVLLGATYMREQQVIGWHRHVTDGLFESVTVIPEGDEDVLYAAVVRQITAVAPSGSLTVAGAGGSPLAPVTATSTGYVFTTSDVGRTLVYPGGSRSITLLLSGNTVQLGTSAAEIAVAAANGTWYFADAVPGAPQTKRFVERMDTRFFTDRREAFFVDCGLTFDGRTGFRGTTTDHTLTTMTISGGTAWDNTELLTVTSSVPIFAYPATTDVGDQIVFEDADGVLYRITISSVTSTTVAKGNVSKVLPVAYRNVARTDWYIARDKMSGLGHLEGKTVSVLADGDVYPQQVVTNGQITLNPPAFIANVGLPYTQDLETLEVLDQTQGVSIGKRKAIPSASVIVEEVASIYAGRDFDHLELRSAPAPTTYDTPFVPESGVIRMSFPTTWGLNGSIAFRNTDPTPVTILGIIPDVNVGN